MQNPLKIMPDLRETFFLRSNDKTLGTVTFERDDWPWNFGVFAPTAEFSSFQPLFVAALAERRDGNTQKQLSDSMQKIIDMKLQLVRCETGVLAGEPDLLWIDGERIWWRGHGGRLRNR